MKPCQRRHTIRPSPVRRPTSLATALGLVLAACLVETVGAGLIEEFEAGEKSIYLAAVSPEVELEVADGEMLLRLPAEARAGLLANRAYEIPEGRPLILQVDVVRATGRVLRANLALEFRRKTQIGEGDGYNLMRFHDSLRLAKYSFSSGETTGCYLTGSPLPEFTGPERMTLSLTRQDRSVILGVKVLRLEGNEVLYTGTFTDTAESDPAFEFTDSGPAFLGPVSYVGVTAVAMEDGTAEVAFREFLCSEAPVPKLLQVTRNVSNEASLAWEGDAVLLESETIHGGWAPFAAPIASDRGQYSARVPFDTAQQFFRLEDGHQGEDGFDSSVEWDVAKAVPGAPGGDLTLRPFGGRGRARGGFLGDRDFVMRRGFGNLWLDDCVVSADLVDWEATMEEGSAFGIVLRANPEDWMWFIEVDGLPERHYLGRLTFKKPGSPAESLLSITGPGREPLQETSLPAVDPAKDYQLRFWAVGDQLTLELLDLEDPGTPIATCSASDGRSPRGIEALYVKPTPVGETRIEVDNFLVRGVHAAAQW